MSNALAGDPHLLKTLYARRLPGLIRYADEAARFTEELIGRLAIDCDYEPTGNVIAAVSPGQLRRTERNTRIRLRAERVLLATNAYSRDLAIAPKRMVTPVWTSLVETEPVAPERLAATGWTRRTGIISGAVRRASDARTRLSVRSASDAVELKGRPRPMSRGVRVLGGGLKGRVPAVVQERGPSSR